MESRRVIISLLTAIMLFGGTPSLTGRGVDNLRISLLTCTGGEELYTAFGHSALRVWDDSLSMDVVFNFGVFDFNTPNFYMKFIRGKLNYMLAIQTTSDFLWQYEMEGRGVIEQELIYLSSQEKQEIMDRLQYLYLPQNRHYLYSFLFKNCTTELRDLLKIEIDGWVPTNYRQLINSYLDDADWTKLGVNFILGSRLDRKISVWESMFLPDKLSDGVADISTLRGVLDREEGAVIAKTPFIFSSIVISGLLLLLVLLSVLWKRARFVQDLLLLLSALVALVLLSIILITDHVELHANYNLIWASPIYIFIVIVKYVYRRDVLLSPLLILQMVLSLGMIPVWCFKIQGFMPQFLIIVSAQLIMLYSLYKRLIHS